MNLQLIYVKRLIDMVSGSSASRFDNLSQSLALYNLNEIQGWVKKTDLWGVYAYEEF